jgi:D-sedoheptulose 7-phosphate isomerase
MMLTSPNGGRVFERAIDEHLAVINEIRKQRLVLENIARAMSASLHAGGKILWCGNGGSAGESQHLAAEIVGRFRQDRRGLASISLTTDTSILTAVANDYGYEAVFSRQVEALGNHGDVLVGMSTSGNSQNVIAALEMARIKGLVTVAFCGATGGKMAPLADYLLAITSKDTARVQEAHLLAGHMICDWIESDWVQKHSEANQDGASGSRGSWQ